MAGAVETQRLISVSLGKIAQSRGQRGGINLHKNLLVASVLNKARTAFMIENYNHQMSLQQQKHFDQQQIILNTPKPTPVSKSSVNEGNRLASSKEMETCQATPLVETRSLPCDKQTHVSNELDSTATPCVLGKVPEVNDKENIFPPAEKSSITLAPVMAECKQESVSGGQHIEAAHQLASDVQNADNSFSSCKLTSGSTTCNSILKRRRVNPEAITDCPVNKKARVSDCSNFQSCDNSVTNSCEIASDLLRCESDMSTSDSPQISNLVTIFNSGFSGLCVSSSTSTSSPYDSTSSRICENNTSVNSQWSSAIKVSDNQYCSSQVERIGSLSSAIMLSA